MSQSNTPMQASAEQASADKLFAIASTVAVIVAIIGGFWLLGSPNKQRLIKLDQERVQNLETVAREIKNETSGSSYENTEGTKDEPLPDRLSESIRNRDFAQDPVTGDVYEYNRLNDEAYELCATFATSTEADSQAQRNSGYQYNNNYRWEHPEGRHCYEIERNATGPKA
ncbi:MAG: hypothetical protein AAGM45_09125 [Cyanobacteria bacterium J06588_5]